MALVSVDGKKPVPVSRLGLSEYLRWLASSHDPLTRDELLRRAERVDALAKAYSHAVVSAGINAPHLLDTQGFKELQAAMIVIEGAAASSKGGA